MYPSGVRGLYFECSIWPTHEDMVKGLIKDGQVTREDVIDAEAFCMGQDHFNRAGRRTLHMGRLDFHMEDFCAESVSHEASHAAFRWIARRNGIAMVNIGTAVQSGNDWVDILEEDHATAVGVISSQIVEKAARFGLR